MSPSRKHLLFAFAAATAILTVILLGFEERRQPRPIATPDMVEPPPDGAETLRFGLFEMGADDVEPQLVEERIVALDSHFRFEWTQPYVRPVYERCTGFSIGVKTPSLVTLPEESKMEEKEIGFRIAGDVSGDGASSRVLQFHLIVDWRGIGFEEERSFRIGPVVHALFNTWSPTYFDDGWRPEVVLVTTEWGTSRPWDLERWRKAIAEGIQRGDGAGQTDCSAAALIPCPAAREALAKGNMTGDVSLARLLAGDALVTSEGYHWSGHNFLDGNLRTAWLLYPDLRAFARKRILAREEIQAYAGPRLAPRFAEDPDLAAKLAMPPMRIHLRWLPPMLGYLLLMLPFVLAMLLPSTPNSGLAATWVSAGCVLSCVQLKIDGIPLPDLLGIPLLCGGAIGLCRAVRPRTLAARIGIMLIGCVIVGQAAMLIGAPSIFSQVGSLAFVTLPLVILAATDPLVPAEARLATDRILWWYAFTNLLYPVSAHLTCLVDGLLGRNMIGTSLQGWVTLLVLLPSFVGLVMAAGGFWRRIRELLPPLPAVKQEIRNFG